MDRRGLAGTVIFDTPPQAARGASGAQHVARWEWMETNRLMPGRLVALVWRAPASTSPCLGPFASTLASAESLTIQVGFVDHSIEVRILGRYQQWDPSQ